MTTTKSDELMAAYPAIDDLTSFGARVLEWFEREGRHDLPWQYHQHSSADIYAVWLSEIMLQQTQVATVLGYYERFLQRFGTVEALASADWQEIAPYWAGLGYYARARNLHAGAKQVVAFIHQNHRFPQTVDEWQAIKGVGRSTAGAIVAMGVRGFGVICDGNVKRVLARHRGITDDITKSATDAKLWTLATALTPPDHSGKYAQAMMDLGATICTRTKPKCERCPVSKDCIAHKNGSQHLLPIKKKAAPKPHRHSAVIRVHHQGQDLWIHRQNGGGIWDGLWCLPLLPLASDAKSGLDAQALKEAVMTAWQTDDGEDLMMAGFTELLPLMTTPTASLRHTLTHFHWHLYLLTWVVDEATFDDINQMLDAMGVEYQWHTGTDLAKPVAMTKLVTDAKSLSA